MISMVSNGLFDLVFNPMKDLIDQECFAPNSFDNQGQQCFYSQNAGQLLFIAACLVVIKLLLRLAVKLSKATRRSLICKVDSFLGANLMLSLIDAVQFDILLAAMLNLVMYSQTTGFVSDWNLALSIASFLFYLAEMFLVAVYCRHVPVPNSNKIKSKDQDPSRRNSTDG